MSKLEDVLTKVGDEAHQMVWGRFTPEADVVPADVLAAQPAHAEYEVDVCVRREESGYSVTQRWTGRIRKVYSDDE